MVAQFATEIWNISCAKSVAGSKEFFTELPKFIFYGAHLTTAAKMISVVLVVFPFAASYVSHLFAAMAAYRGYKIKFHS
jgi:hypothetical protein